MHQYGIPIQELPELIASPEASATDYGRHACLATDEHYRLEQFVLAAGSFAAIEVATGLETTLFVEEGRIKVQETEILPHRQVTLASGTTVVTAIENSTLYAFSGAADESSISSGFAPGEPQDYRDKYWGDIRTMVNAVYTGKRLFFKRGQHSSLHYHVDKHEAYYIHSGKLLVRLRAGRGEDAAYTLNAGDTLFIPRGLMHQDGGLEDTVIIEVSTHDDDRDSFIVEDGSTTEMPGFPS